MYNQRQVAATAYNRQRSIAYSYLPKETSNWFTTRRKELYLVILAKQNLQLVYHQDQKGIAYSYLQKKPPNVLPPWEKPKEIFWPSSQATVRSNHYSHLLIEFRWTSSQATARSIHYSHLPIENRWPSSQATARSIHYSHLPIGNHRTAHKQQQGVFTTPTC